MIEAIVNLIVYEFLLLVFFSPAWIIFAIIPDGEKGSILSGVKFCFAILMIIAYFATPWLAHRATRRRLNGEQFHAALMGAFTDARFHLSFLPLVGIIFQPKKHGDQFESSDPIE